MSVKFIIAAALLASSSPVFAQAPASSAPPSPFAGMVRFAGTVTRADGRHFSVHGQDGTETTLTLPEHPSIMVSGTGTVADLAAGKFVGCTAVQRDDKVLHATECHIFPESMRGMGEGHNPMGSPNTTMTNGNVATMTNGNVASMTNGEVTSRSGVTNATLQVTYKGGQQSIQVGPETTITRISAGTIDMIKPGVKAMGGARPAADGSATVVFLSLNP